METLGDMLCEARTLLDDLPDTTGYASTNLLLLENAAEALDEDNLLWKTTELTRWANEAMDEVAIRSRCIRDSSETVGLTKFTVTANSGVVTIPRSIIRILRVTWDGLAISPASKQSLSRENAEWADEAADAPTHFILDQGTRRMYLYPTNTLQGILRLEVVRRPSAAMTLLTDIPEVPADMLGDAVYWILHKAYLKNDSETRDPNMSAQYEAMFTRAFGPKPSHLEMEFDFQSLAVTPRGRFEWR